MTTIRPFGEYDGRLVNKYTIRQPNGIEVSVINYGATITSIIAPDRTGTPADVVLGFNTLEGYIRAGHSYIGGLCGRFANRIKNARFQIDGQEYPLSKNSGQGCLHGGFYGFDKKFWESETLPEQNGVRFTYFSKDGEEGFPGNLNVRVTYTVVESALHIEFRATTDKACPVNLTSHTYFNLSGGDDATILDHLIRIHSDRLVEVDDELMPTGNLLPVANTQLDFKEYKRIGEVIQDPKGIDYSWVLDSSKGELHEVVSLVHQASGRQLTVHTTQPAVHFYSGHFLDGKAVDTKNHIVYERFAGLCLETQHFPDSPNQLRFPNTIIRPGELYKESAIYRFGIVPGDIQEIGTEKSIEQHLT